MARALGQRSRIVARLKWALPVLALVFLSTLILFSNPRPASLAVGITDAALIALASRGGVGTPRVTTKTGDGYSVAMTAEAVQPRAGAAGLYDATQINARIESKTREILDATADTGVMDTTTQEVRLAGNVVLVSSTGYRAETGGLTVSLDKTKAVSETTIIVTGSLGRLEAGRMEIREKIPNSGKNIMIFTEGVKVIYLPQQDEGGTR